MKKRLLTLLSVFSALLLIACSSNSSKTEEKFYDREFLHSLATGLDKRWTIADSEQWTEGAKGYEELIQTELKELEGYTGKKFESSELQELAISYINELKKGLTLAGTFGSDSFYTNFSKHVDVRTSLLVDINELSKIPVKQEDTLNELLAQGQEAKTESNKETAIHNLVNGIAYVLDESKSDEYSKIYFSEVENTTEYTIKDLSVSVNLIDANGTTVGTVYVNATNWKPGQKTRFEFYGLTNEFVKTENTVEFYNAE